MYNRSMTKADKCLILILMICSIVLFFPILKQAPSSHIASVQVKNKEVLRIDLRNNAEYEVDGTLGSVHIVVKDEKIKVSQENSPNHLCSKQGFVSDANVPIVCLPNDTVVQIEKGQEEEDLVIR